MATIDTDIPMISEPPKVGDDHSTWREKGEKAWNSLYIFAPRIKLFASQTNDVRNEVNMMHADAQRFSSSASSSAESAANAADRAESVVIPAEATYNATTIDDMFEFAVNTAAENAAKITYLEVQQ